jgi:RNA polymerase sigma-70 factor (ECF subfamily)
MLTIAARRAIDVQRQLVATQRMHDEVQVRAANAILSPSVNDWIASALADLTAEHRAVLLLSDVYEFDHREIAKALAIEIGTVKSRLSRARAAMRANAPQQARLA